MPHALVLNYALELLNSNLKLNVIYIQSPLTMNLIKNRKCWVSTDVVKHFMSKLSTLTGHYQYKHKLVTMIREEQL